MKLLGTFGASLLENLLTGKGTTRAGEDNVSTGQDFQCANVISKLNKGIRFYYVLFIFLVNTHK